MAIIKVISVIKHYCECNFDKYMHKILVANIHRAC